MKISDPNILPPTSNFTANNTSFCAGNCVSFTNQSLNDSSWLWLFPGGNPSSSNLKNPPNICYQTSGVFSVSLITYNSAGTDTLTILNYLSVNPLPIALANSNSPVCEGQSLTLTSNSGTSYLWSGPNGFVSNLQNPVIINTTLSNTGIFTLVLTNNNGCADTASISVVINSNTPIVTSSNSPVCEGKDFTLFANVATSYSWSGPNGFTSNQQNPIINNITISNSGTYSVAITNICGSGNASFSSSGK
ncbi:MAG: hypothetical protein IPM91_02300 [Bacteroidetes bacterium]|nr:hypothetical protein [Bacteroidota bacterium]